MTGIGHLCILLLASLPVFGSRIIHDNFDLLQDPNPKLPSRTRRASTPNITKFVDGYMPRRNSISTKPSVSFTTLAPTLVRLSHPLDARSLPFRPEAICSASNQDLICQVFFAVSSSVAAAASSSASDSVLASASAGFSSSLLTAHEGGFQDGLKEASESAQNAISAVEASASSMVSSILSALGNTASPIVTTSLTGEGALPSMGDTSYSTASISPIEGDPHTASHRLSLGVGQFVGIVVAVFIAASILSIVATLCLLRYRRKRIVDTGGTVHSRVKKKRKEIWSVLTGERHGTVTTNRYDAPGGFPRRLEQGMSPRFDPTVPSPNQAPLDPLVSPGSANDGMYPVSPISDQAPNTSRRASSATLGIGLYGNRAQIPSISEFGDVPPIKLSIARAPVDGGSQHLQVIRTESYGTGQRRAFSQMRAARMSQSESGITWRPDPDTQGFRNGIERGAPGPMRIASLSTLSPPIVPLRFSSLNAHIGTSAQSSVGLRSEDQTFLLSTDDESTGRDARTTQAQTEIGPYRSSHSSVISHDPTQFDPGGPSQQPISRFSMSSGPVSTSEHRTSSSSPVGPDHQDQQQWQEYPEILALRPAPLSPSQIRSPIRSRGDRTLPRIWMSSEIIYL